MEKMKNFTLRKEKLQIKLSDLSVWIFSLKIWQNCIYPTRAAETTSIALALRRQFAESGGLRFSKASHFLPLASQIVYT